MDEDVIRRARKSNTEPGSEEDNGLSAAVRRLAGILPEQASEDEYRAHLEAKYGT